MIEIKNLCKNFGEKEALKDVNLTVEDGQICGLLGLNGAGKSTLMKIICSLAIKNSGAVFLNGKEILKNEINNEGIGFMIESPAFYPNLTGRQNLNALSLLYDNIKKGRVNELLKIVGLFNQADTHVKKYSLGMKQRLYFAYALLNYPSLVILDEPFNGIDPVTVKLFRDIIFTLKKQNCSILVSSHMIADIKAICDKIVIIDNGEVIYTNAVEKDMDLESIFLEKVSATGVAQ